MDSQLLFGYPINVVPMRKRVPRCQPAMLYVALHARLGDLKLFLSFRWEIQLGLVTHTVQIRYSVVLFHWTLIIQGFLSHLPLKVFYQSDSFLNESFPKAHLLSAPLFTNNHNIPFPGHSFPRCFLIAGTASSHTLVEQLSQQWSKTGVSTLHL